MSKILSVSVAALVVGLIMASSTARAEDLQFTLINKTSKDITEFQVSPPNEKTWSSDLMPEGYVLPAGNEVDVNIVDGRDHCEYDLKAVFSDGSEASRMGENLCELGSWTITD